MAYSDWSNRKPVLNYIRQSIASISKGTIEILDLGMGAGCFGKLIKEKIDSHIKITGVEVWERYRNSRWDFYNEITLKDIREFIKEEQRKFDIILFLDVLEHFDKFQGREILDFAMRQAKQAILLSTPITKYPQGACGGNPFEEHRSTWTDDELFAVGFKALRYRWVPTFKLRPFFALYGVYVFERIPQ
ncbi:MAG: class I SAM-dependent methyltransferase [Acidobacteriia bacterium]|nr:class I SAM-dependent methyltransferase [Terriglobia bacterium]